MNEPIAAKKPLEVKLWDDRASRANGSRPSGLGFGSQWAKWHSICPFRRNGHPFPFLVPGTTGSLEGIEADEGGRRRQLEPAWQGESDQKTGTRGLPALSVGSKRAQNGPFRAFCEPASWLMRGQRAVSLTSLYPP